jgi:putative hydrolase of HD superfamily
MNPETLIGFLEAAGKLKQIPRTGWIDLGIPHPESVADHSYRAALAAMLLSDSLGLDTLKVVRMSLLHDLAESETGDLTPSQKDENHEQLEDEAMTQILSTLMEPTRGLYLDAWREFKSKETDEAVLVNDADKIEMVLQASEYQKMYPETDLHRFYHAMVSPGIKEIVESIKKD